MHSLSIKRHLAGWCSLKIILLWQVSVRSAGESPQILLHCKHHQVKFCSELHKKQGLNVAVLIPGDIPTAFVHIPKKHVSPQNFYQNFSFFLISPRNSPHSPWPDTQPMVLVVFLFTAAWKERQYMGKWFQIRNGEHCGVSTNRIYIFKKLCSSFGIELSVISKLIKAYKNFFSPLNKQNCRCSSTVLCWG